VNIQYSRPAPALPKPRREDIASPSRAPRKIA
jgi:hypothetical protein